MSATRACQKGALELQEELWVEINPDGVLNVVILDRGRKKFDQCFYTASRLPP
jgi:hypothetical protein